MTAPTPQRTRTALTLFALVIAFLSVVPAVGAVPTLGTGSGSRQTVTWTLNETAGLDIDGIQIENGSAVLEWTNDSIAWTEGPQFVQNGSLLGLTADPTGVELAADSSNHVIDGDFAVPGPWELLPAPNVHVAYEPSSQDVQVEHSSSPSANVSFDQMDTRDDPNWSNIGSGLSTCGLSWVPSPNDGGGNMSQCLINLDSPPGSWAGIVRNSANWSGYDRLIITVFAAEVDPQDWWFRISAIAGGTQRNTSLQPLRALWQEITVDLTELGPDRGALTSVRFIVVGSSIPGRIVDFDDIRLANAETIDETGRMRQALSKANATDAAPGSAFLAFDYQVVESSGVDFLSLTVNLSGVDGSYVREIIPAGPGVWATYSADVSSSTASTGTYSLELSVRVALQTIAASNAVIRIDNVTITFPNRGAGTFLSRVVDFGLISPVRSLSWSGSVPFQTTATVRIRTGNESDPSGPTWSTWRVWTAPGVYPSDRGPSRYLQVGLDLATLNASRTPVVDAINVDVVHRSAIGSIEAEYTVADPEFGSWSLVELRATVPSGTGVTVHVQGEGPWTAVTSGEVPPLGGSTSIRWRLNVTSTDGLITPELGSVVLTYEHLLIPANVAAMLLNPYTLATLAAVALGYSSYAVARRRLFAVDDVFLVSREGRLMMHNTRRMRADRDEDILSGMLTAILAFVKDSDPESNGELHQFKVGDKTTVLEKGKHSYVAATYSGRVPPWAARDLRRFLKDLEARFGDAFARWSGDPEDLQGLKEFTARFVSRSRYRPRNDAKGRAA
jgi:hypothetical protein